MFSFRNVTSFFKHVLEISDHLQQYKKAAVLIFMNHESNSSVI